MFSWKDDFSLFSPRVYIWRILWKAEANTDAHIPGIHAKSCHCKSNQGGEPLWTFQEACEFCCQVRTVLRYIRKWDPMVFIQIPMSDINDYLCLLFNKKKTKLEWIFPKCKSGYTITVLNLAKGTWSIHTETGLGRVEGVAVIPHFLICFICCYLLFNIYLDIYI